VTQGTASLPQLDTAAEEYKLFTSHNDIHNNINTCNNQTSQNNREKPIQMKRMLVSHF